MSVSPGLGTPSPRTRRRMIQLADWANHIYEPKVHKSYPRRHWFIEFALHEIKRLRTKQPNQRLMIVISLWIWHTFLLAVPVFEHRNHWKPNTRPIRSHRSSLALRTLSVSHHSLRKGKQGKTIFMSKNGTQEPCDLAVCLCRATAFPGDEWFCSTVLPYPHRTRDVEGRRT